MFTATAGPPRRREDACRAPQGRRVALSALSAHLSPRKCAGPCCMLEEGRRDALSEKCAHKNVVSGLEGCLKSPRVSPTRPEVPV